MSFVHAAPPALTAAASEIAGIGSTINAANAAAASPTTGVMAAAADQVSAQVAALFSSYGQGYQQLSAQFAAFHDQFAQALNASANAYAATEASAAQNLVNALTSPAEKLLGQPMIDQSGIAPNVVSQLQNVFAGTGGSSVLGGAAAANIGAGAAALAPTGGTGALAAGNALLQPVASAAAAAVIPVSVATAIENFYLAVEPWVEYGFLLASWAAGWLPYVGILAPQIMFLYYLFEPIVQSALFNTLDWLDGTITFSQGLSNLWAATDASLTQFIITEINWLLSFLPPLPPLP
ncbi:PE family protein [Mycobacterium shinjukuense]|uniref:PE family protein PE12 n=1 Tax=Mycobacterium shinjukuense TaxID=398694 RepID=A0A7I7MK01_9MYCO|nr:PE family protein [Mycobacterium shinjukuense]MCV6985531.1 PE family protein [Mycobacterium shinjukuense]ORB64902.1 PE family protein [Mycobacterium shinjukuense]BBX72475.1 PE family protein PE12 [Mycobacterium shinjukuense]